ncbi:Serine/threonine-protein kinase EDR1 [Geodia barretti]|nr:Serine/threonine-protein kinase EDR1 [Geodia barretti]
MYLMSRGADWRHTDKDGDTALHFACMKAVPQGQHEKTLEYLLTTPLFQLKDAQNTSGETPLNTACKCKFVDRVKLLLQFKADAGLPNHKGELPIHRACISDLNIEALLYLVELCPDINVPDGDGWTPLMFAAKSGSSAIAKYLVQRGANPNLTQSAGFSALYLASQEDNSCLCQVLLEAGADSNLTGSSQALSPLHIAAHKGNKTVCMLLVRHGGDIRQEDSDGDTPLDLAETAELKQAMLLAHSVRRNQVAASSAADPVTSCTLPPSELTNQNHSLPPSELTNQNHSLHQEQLTNQNHSLPTELTNQNHSTASNPSSCETAEEGEETETPQSPPCSPGQPTTPDNDTGTGEWANGRTEERENGSMRGDKMCNRRTSSKESFDIGERRNGDGDESDMLERGVGPEDWKNKRVMEKFSELLKLIESYRQRLAEVEEEMRQLCVDKELLMCRNRSLMAELHSRDTCGGTTGESTGGCGHTNPSWLISSSSEYEITGRQLNTSAMRFFNVYHGTYRDIPVIVKKVLCVEGWGPDLYSLFQEEAVKISQLQCPYVVQLLGAKISHGESVCALICETMMRGCLHLLLHVDKPHMEWGQRLRIVRDVCSGMAFIHSHNILHRNLLPRNILVGEHFNAKISDFGFFELKKVCNFYSKLRAQSTEPQVYMAPEAMEKDQFTAAADVYSFGMVMWEVAMGKAPFEEDKKQLSPVLLVVRLLLGQRPEFSPHHDHAYQKIAKSCWHSDPNLRPTFSTLLPELRELRE